MAASDGKVERRWRGPAVRVADGSGQQCPRVLRERLKVPGGDGPLRFRRYRQPGAQTHVHSLIDQEWRQLLRSNPIATRQELLNFRDYQDWRFQHTFWESQTRPKP